MKCALRVVGIALFMAIVASCGGGTASSDSTELEVVEVWDPPVLQWTECGTNLSCTTLTVPRDYAHPDLGVFELPVTRYRSALQTERIGSLLVNPGGPGSGGTYLAEYADYYYSETLLDRFDIVGWDPRGTGGSIPSIDCVDDLDPYFSVDPSPDSSDETDSLMASVEGFATECEARSGDVLPFVGTIDSARDIDTLRRALGEESISYLGFSYGSELGATWSTMFPDTVRAAVLDASVDPTLGYADSLIEQAAGFEAVLDRFFEHCDLESCVYMQNGETAAEGFDRIGEKVENQPLPTYEGRVSASAGVFQTAAAASLYADFDWFLFVEALAAADTGDGGMLLELYDGYMGEHVDGRTLGNEIEAYFGILCLERSPDLDSEAIFALDSVLAERAPRVGRGWLQEMLVCANWPVAPNPRPAIDSNARDRMLVVGSTGDAATPLAGTKAMAAALGDVPLVVVDSNQHTSYGSNECATTIVDRFLIEAAPPTKNSNC